MKINIKPFLTGATLVIASASNINAVPPKGIKLIDGATITHPVFGKMKVISHKEELEYYKKKTKDLIGKDPFGDEDNEAKLLEENFIKYVLNADSLKQAKIPQEDIEKFVKECCRSQAGMAALKVITAHYMREYDRVKQFCEKHEKELKAYYELSRMKEWEELYGKERQIFELEEKLRESFFKENRKVKGVKEKRMSRNDLVCLYKHFLKEESLFAPVKLRLESLSKTNSVGFRLTSVWQVVNVYKHFSKGETKALQIGCLWFVPDSDNYKRLKEFYDASREDLERIFKIDNLLFGKDHVDHGSLLEGKMREFYQKHKKDLEGLSELCNEGSELQKTKEPNTQVKQAEVLLENAYRKGAETANEEKFSCIRRSVMPACYFPILYRHFFIKGDFEYSDIKSVNKFLYRALKLHNSDDSCVFIPETLSIGLKKEVKELKNYHVNRQGEFSAFEGDRYGALLHELMHFMNAIDSFDGSTEGENIRICDIESIEDVISDLTFSRKDLPLKKPTIEKEDGDDDVVLAYKRRRYLKEWEDKSKKEPDENEQKNVCEELVGALGKLYDNGAEAWTMYGIFICENKQNSGNKQNPEDSEEDSDDPDPSKEYEFYYDPINEAVADAECKIINGKQKEVVRTGHTILGDDSCLPKYEGSPLNVEMLNKKVDIYKFYFAECGTLRELICK